MQALGERRVLVAVTGNQGSLVFGGFAFLPVSLGPAGDCQAGPRDRVEALSPGLPEIKERSGIWNLVPVG